MAGTPAGDETRQASLGRIDLLDLVGLLLAVAFAMWVLLVAARVGGRPWPPIALSVGTVAAVFVGRRLGMRVPLVVPALVAAAPILAALINQRSLLGDGPLGYSNASGALYLVAAAAALVAAATTTHGVIRTASYGVTVLWVVLPWMSGARTAALAATLLFLVVLVRDPGRTKRLVLLASSVVALAGIAATLLLGATYEPGGRTSVADRLVDATLGELRVVLWADAVELLEEHPLLGIGPGRFAEESPLARDRDDAEWAHDEYVEVAVETGLVGGLFVLAIVAWLLARSLTAPPDRRSLAAAIALGGVAAQGAIDYTWHFPLVVLGLAALVGTTGVRTADPPAAPRLVLSPQQGSALVATMVLWVLLLLPLTVTNPAYTIPNEVTHLAPTSGVGFSGDGGVLVSSAPPVRLYERLADRRALTIELWAAAHDLDQDGPARLISASRDAISRNLTVGQDGDALVFRLRTSETTWNGTYPHLTVDGVFTSTELQHVVVTTTVQRTRVYVDGVLRADEAGPGGTLDGWIHTYPLLLGNETSGDRPWLGELRSVAIHDRDLAGTEVRRRFELGSGEGALLDIEPPPVAAYTFDSDDTITDRSPEALGGDLTTPARLAAPAPGYRAVMTDLEDLDPARWALVAITFAAWAVLATRAIRERIGALVASLLVVGAGSGIALAASVARYGSGRAPSVLDVAAASVGAVFGYLLWDAKARRTLSGPAPRG